MRQNAVSLVYKKLLDAPLLRSLLKRSLMIHDILVEQPSYSIVFAAVWMVLLLPQQRLHQMTIGQFTFTLCVRRFGTRTKHTRAQNEFPRSRRVPNRQCFGFFVFLHFAHFLPQPFLQPFTSAEERREYMMDPGLQPEGSVQ